MIKINLLPVKARKKTQVNRDLFLFIAMLVLGLGLVGVVYVNNMKDLSRTQKEIGATKQAVARLQDIYKEYQSIEKQKKEIERRIAVIDQIKEGRPLASRVLYDLPSVVKENVWLTKYKKDGEKFELEGRSLENESIADFIDKLSKIPYYRNVELKTAEDVTEQGIVVKKFIVQGNIGL